MTSTSLPSSVRIETGAGGLPRVAIENRHGRAEMYFQGAHLTAWHPSAATAPVLWLSRDSLFEANRPIRGGVPICFPWFGPHATDPTAPGHGFGRLRPWTLTNACEDDDGIVTVTMELSSLTADAAATTPAWPHRFDAQFRVAVGPSLTMELEVRNPGSEPFTFEEALHTYFAVQDVREVTVTGLEDTEYLDKVAAFSRRQQGQEPIRFTGETDRIYLNTRATCQIHDPGLRRTITIRKTGSDTTVVWNPWIDKARAMPDFGDLEWPGMLCVETCNVNRYTRTLAPGESHTMTATIDVS